MNKKIKTMVLIMKRNMYKNKKIYMLQEKKILKMLLLNVLQFGLITNAL